MSAFTQNNNQGHYSLNSSIHSIDAPALRQQHTFDEEEIEPLQADTLVSAILQAKEHLPPHATIEQVIWFYYKLKLDELDKLGASFEQQFIEKLNTMENLILNEAALEASSPPNSRQHP